MNAKSEAGGTAWSYVSDKNHDEIVNLLRAAGAKSPDQVGLVKESIVQASEWGHIEIVKLLLNKGIDPNSVEREGLGCLSALRGAATGPISPGPGHVGIVRLLLENGADPYEINCGGQFNSTPFYYSSCKTEISNLLRAAGGKPSTQVKIKAGEPIGEEHTIYGALRGETLGEAIQKDDLNRIKFLFDMGVDISVVTCRVYSAYCGGALKVATLYGHADIVKFLQSKGVDSHSPKKRSGVRNSMVIIR